MKLKKIRFLIEYAFVLMFFYGFRYIPLKIKLIIGGFLGKLLYYIDKRHRKIAIKNVSSAFPELKEEEVIRIVKENFKNLGYFAMEIVHLPRMNKRFVQKHVEMEGIDHFINQGKNGGFLGIFGHFGSWELLSSFLGSLEPKGYVIAQRQTNPYVTKFIERLREMYGYKVIYNNEPVTKMLRILKEGKILGILPDQDAGFEGIFVKFFGIDASTTKGPAILVLASKKPIIMIYPIRTGLGKYKLITSKPIFYNPTGDKEKDIYNITSIWVKELENMIRKYPEQYFWVHRRFKTRPGRKRNFY